jgi:hypothetical protein
LVVDEAQNLPAETVEELRMLSNFQTDKRSLIQSFLLGQEEFRQTINSPGMEQLRQRIIASCHLEPLDKKETRLYIEHRLKEVGWSSRPVITDIAFELIHNFTNGVPRRINVFCDRLLLFGYLEELFVFKPEVINKVAEELAAEVKVPNEPIKALADTADESSASKRQTASSTGASITASDEQIEHLELVVESLEKALQDKLSQLKKSVERLKQ